MAGANSTSWKAAEKRLHKNKDSREMLIITAYVMRRNIKVRNLEISKTAKLGICYFSHNLAKLLSLDK